MVLPPGWESMPKLSKFSSHEARYSPMHFGHVWLMSLKANSPSFIAAVTPAWSMAIWGFVTVNVSVASALVSSSESDSLKRSLARSSESFRSRESIKEMLRKWEGLP